MRDCTTCIFSKKEERHRYIYIYKFPETSLLQSYFEHRARPSALVYLSTPEDRLSSILDSCPEWRFNFKHKKGVK
jgi:hypothetical protein